MATKNQKKVTKKPTTPETSLERTSSFAENYGSTILGFIVVLILGSFLFNVFRGNNNNGEVGSGEETNQEEQADTTTRTHTVARGEDLWKISEQYYNTGYNWSDIARANNITNPNDIEEGQTLTIPDITPFEATIEPTEVAQTTEAPEATQQPTQQPVEEQDETQPTQTPEATPETSGNYTVVKGDTLWSIAVSQYNDGYKWVEIARANKLVNPDVIHAGNTLILPR